jgi:hypothetical protein
VNDWLGRIAYSLRSKDGIHWKVDPGEAYLPGIARYEDGTTEDWFKYERIKVLQDEYGRATQAHFAVIDVLKNDDKGSDRHSSKHICIPLTVGRLLTVLNEDKITPETENMRVKIAAEQDCDPLADIDIQSLRFGAPEEVDFGRGCRPVRTEADGKDLIVIFDGAGNGLNDDHFAAKMLGRKRDGTLFFGYARLPWVDYMEPALSARMPDFVQVDGKSALSVEVQNFGQVSSTDVEVSIYVIHDGQAEEVASGAVPRLKPFEKTSLKLDTERMWKPGESAAFKVVIDPAGQKPVILEGSHTPLP